MGGGWGTCLFENPSAIGAAELGCGGADTVLGCEDSCHGAASAVVLGTVAAMGNASRLNALH